MEVLIVPNHFNGLPNGLRYLETVETVDLEFDEGAKHRAENEKVGQRFMISGIRL